MWRLSHRLRVMRCLEHFYQPKVCKSMQSKIKENSNNCIVCSTTADVILLITPDSPTQVVIRPTDFT
jgi:hypothetical protein